MASKRKKPFSKKSGYLKFIWVSFQKPFNFVATISTLKDFKKALFFGLCNICLGLLLEIVLKVLLINRWELFFPSVSEIFFPVLFILFFLILFGVFLHLLAKILKGKGSFKSSVAATLFSTSPLILSFLPILQIAALLYWVFLLIISFLKIHQYSKTKAVVNIIVPLGGLVIALFALGLINLLN